MQCQGLSLQDLTSGWPLCSETLQGRTLGPGEGKENIQVSVEGIEPGLELGYV